MAVVAAESLTPQKWPQVLASVAVEAAEALTPQKWPQVLLASPLLSSTAVVAVALALTSSLRELSTSAGVGTEMGHSLPMVK